MRLPNFLRSQATLDAEAAAILPWWRKIGKKGFYHEAPRADQTFFSPNRADGWTNALTGLGTQGRDKLSSGWHTDTLRIPDPELTSLFHGDDIAAKIVEMRPKEMFRQGYEVCIADETGDEISEDACDYAEKLGLDTKVLHAMIWGRLFGGCLLVVGAIDGAQMFEPLNEDGIRSIEYLTLIDRRFSYVQKYYTDPMKPKFGEPELYQVVNSMGGPVALVHESRVIRFDGIECDILKKRELGGWTLSVLQRCYDRLRELGSSFQAVSNLMVDASQAVFKINGLMEAITSGEKDALGSRMQLVDMYRSSARAVLLDVKEGEDFTRQATPLTGIPETLDRLMMRVASAADMPVTVLFGRSPAGLNATGENDTRLFYDTIASEQTNILEPALRRLYDLIFLAKDGPTSGAETDYEIEFAALWEPTDLEQATLEKTIGERDNGYIASGVLMAEEVALSRFGSGGFSIRTDIDKEAREASLAAELDFSVQQAEQKAELGPIDPTAMMGPPAPGAPPPAPGKPAAPPPPAPKAKTDGKAKQARKKTKPKK